MATEHLTHEALLALAAKPSSEAVVSAAAAHLALCSACRGLLGSLPEDLGSAVRQQVATADPTKRYSVLDYRRVIQRVGAVYRTEESLAERARETARGLFDDLVSYPLARRRLVAANLPRFQVWALAELLLEESRNAWNRDPNLAEVWAQIAVDITAGLRGSGYRELLLNDLRAEAWSFLANAYRIRGRLDKAEWAFDNADSYLAQGSGEVLDLVQLLDLKVSFLRDAGRYQDAFDILEQVIACRRSLGDDHLVARGLVSKAKLLREWGRLDESVALLREAEDLLERGREPLLELNLKINLMTYLLLLGRLGEAQLVLGPMKQLARKVDNRLERLRSLWVEARLRCGLGQRDLGEELLRTVHEGFLHLEVAHEAAAVALDLALLYLDMGRVDDVRALSERVRQYAGLVTCDAEREAVAALLGLAEPAEDLLRSRALLDRLSLELRSLPARTRHGEDFD